MPKKLENMTQDQRIAHWEMMREKDKQKRQILIYLEACTARPQTHRHILNQVLVTCLRGIPSTLLQGSKRR